ncbi:Dihydrolipoamide acetyltransferase component of pyruvate dehydrogenase complex [Rubellimicrobium mesophilum DSM 19309]|uniref:Acetyltransferase component of pyruvate dehydrogenase complex n=1 Tax=Rubellimicrobium mesophilum DSM 19309 TaxID=442562 RepID=A0A017HJ99_9RHOB|nr:pyruvate dehydrogenase complex dihydrolipoamide acetyltransferase [Rubellimicrobium mesophilum]EYD74431.1 Dihydrolipoamide acetyltransferase component of pyruvate dehydrogenase complex [Rubellimicrobium mesophilum DSM 19309]
MPTQILMPALSPTMEEGTLAKWLVKEGDTVKSGDVMAEIETDKATMEFEAVDEGVIGRILVPEGSEGVKVNTPIALLLGEGEDASAVPAAGGSGAAKASDAPAPSGEIADYSLGPVPERTGDAPAGVLDAAAAKREDGTPAGGGAAPQPQAKPSEGGRVFASPLARRIAGEKGIDLSAVKGSGPNGRIVKADVEGFKPSAAAAAQPAAPTPAASQPALAAEAPKAAPAPTADAILRMYEGREIEEVKLDGMRKTIAARLTEAKQTIPHFYLRRDIQLDALLAFRAQLNGALEPRKVKLSVNDFIIKACALALQQVPNANAIWAGDRIVKLKPSDVAVAVAIEGGLFTPVLKDAHLKSLSALSAEMKDLAARARSRKLAPQEYQGGSFAISNLGMFGIDNFDAVINPPHGAILAVGAGVKKPVVGANDQIEVATVMSVTLSVDHRVIDGALGAELLQAIKDNLENPVAMLA